MLPTSDAPLPAPEPERQRVEVTTDGIHWGVVDVTALTCARKIKLRILRALNWPDYLLDELVFYPSDLHSVRPHPVDEDSLLALCIQQGDAYGSLKFYIDWSPAEPVTSALSNATEEVSGSPVDPVLHSGVQTSHRGLQEGPDMVTADTRRAIPVPLPSVRRMDSFRSTNPETGHGMPPCLSGTNIGPSQPTPFDWISFHLRGSLPSSESSRMDGCQLSDRQSLSRCDWMARGHGQDYGVLPSGLPVPLMDACEGTRDASVSCDRECATVVPGVLPTSGSSDSCIVRASVNTSLSSHPAEEPETNLGCGGYCPACPAEGQYGAASASHSQGSSTPEHTLRSFTEFPRATDRDQKVDDNGFTIRSPMSPSMVGQQTVTLPPRQVLPSLQVNAPEAEATSEPLLDENGFTAFSSLNIADQQTVAFHEASNPLAEGLRRERAAILAQEVGTEGGSVSSPDTSGEPALKSSHVADGHEDLAVNSGHELALTGVEHNSSGLSEAMVEVRNPDTGEASSEGEAGSTLVLPVTNIDPESEDPGLGLTPVGARARFGGTPTVEPNGGEKFPDFSGLQPSTTNTHVHFTLSPPIANLDGDTDVGPNGTKSGLSARSLLDLSEELPDPNDWAVRPPEDVLYGNLDKVFPGHDLDTPVIRPVASKPGMAEADKNIPPDSLGDMLTHPLAPAPPSMQISRPIPQLTRDRKSIRIVARDTVERVQERGAVDGAGLRRHNTRMWGMRTVEVRPGAPPEEMAKKEPGVPTFVWVKGHLIGQGAYGKVYHALNGTTGEMMAVKQMELPSTRSDRVSDRQARIVKSFLSEMETLEKLADHPNIVSYLGCERGDDFLSIFLEYVGGGSIGLCYKKHGSLDEPTVAHFTRQIARGLAFLHSNNIFHRDIKAENILVDYDGSVKISDFGTACHAADVYDDIEGISLQGTLPWMAPEVFNLKDRGYSAKADIWSLGCVVLEMFAGELSWSLAQIIAAYRSGRTFAPPIPDDESLSDRAKAFIRRCHAIDPEQRPTAEALLSDPFLTTLPEDWDFRSSPLYHALPRPQ